MIPRASRRWTLSALAERLGARVVGDGGRVLERAGPLDEADERTLAAVYAPRFLSRARASGAGALVVPLEWAGRFPGRDLLASPAPKATFARAVALLHPRRAAPAGVHPAAVLGRDVALGEGVAIGALAFVGDRCRIEDGAIVGPGAVLLEDVVVGAGAEIHPKAVLYPGTEIAAGARVYAGAVIGAPGFGQARDERGRAVRVPHIGRVEIGEEAEVGANAAVDRATFGRTVVGARARLDNLVQIGHNARVGADALVAAQSGLSGSSVLGDRVRVGGQSGLADHVEVGEDAVIAAKTAVFADVPAGAAVAGIPARPLALWRRLVAVEARLPRLWTRLVRLLGKP